MQTIHSIKTKEIIRKKLRKDATPQEIILWSRLRRGKLGYKFRRQHSIGKYIVDFYCSEKKLIIELDGWQHREEVNDGYDIERTKFLESLGYRVLRFWNNDVNKNIEGVVLKIEEFLKG
ncbi:MAG: hypothetical protein US25_C0005G0007 [Candidatus Moranbacteria bacterium GW2011_GWE1_36_7]|nr:MAG: hypothetical protein UR99_C0008G0015 [Candidatus Moranbacteria bacterium GW2011_GWD2_36_12]KKQ06833.1 MAG: hypothetical protein US16_C0008G0010 [Candidatus Moranbacteria bacterium GW2011_GWE2_36_40]KKQ15423.1 MAG: hypothetical protein US25_C0005G0007 [Candidatus Moranbacteria bacterium GW2011_GWE1_36_7]